MLIVLCGKTCSGKTTLRDCLAKEYGCMPVVTVTTRPMRSGEADGRDYFFRTDEEFAEMEQNGEFLETADYHTIQPDGSRALWRYGSLRASYANAIASRDNYVVILTQDGVKALDRAGLDGYLLAFIDITDTEMSRRQAIRHDEPKEASRRRKADALAFSEMPEICRNRGELGLQFNASSTLSPESMACTIMCRLGGEKEAARAI